MARLKTKGMSKSDIVRQYLGRHSTASVSQIVSVLQPYGVSESLAAKIKYDENRMAPKAAAPAAASSNGGGTKADLIRETAGGLEKPIRPRDVVAALKEQGIDVSRTQVSQVLQKMGMRKRRRRKAAGSAARGSGAARVSGAARAVAGNSALLNIDDLIAAKKLVAQVGSIEKVKEALSALARLS